MISWKATRRNLLTAGVLAAGLGLAGCAAYPAGYGGYAWGYGPDYYGYGVDYWPGYYNGVWLGGVAGGTWWGGRDHWRGWNGWAGGWHGNRVAHGAVRGGNFAALHGGIGKFGARVGGGHFGGGRMAAGGIGHFGGEVH